MVDLVLLEVLLRRRVRDGAHVKVLHVGVASPERSGHGVISDVQ